MWENIRVELEQSRPCKLGKGLSRNREICELLNGVRKLSREQLLSLLSQYENSSVAALIEKEKLRFNVFCFVSLCE